MAVSRPWLIYDVGQKYLMKALFLLLTLCVATRAVAEMQFVGVMADAKQTLFALRSSEAERSQWFTVGDAIGDFVIIAYDSADEALTLRHGDTSVILRLPEARVRSGQGENGGVGGFGLSPLSFMFGVTIDGAFAMGGKPAALTSIQKLLHEARSSRYVEIKVRRPMTKDLEAETRVSDAIRKLAEAANGIGFRRFSISRLLKNS